MLATLEKCIEAMNVLKIQEKESNDTQKQENIDEIFKEAVFENDVIINAVEVCYQKFNFKVSQLQREKIVQILKSSSDAVYHGNIQEATAKKMRDDLVKIKKGVLDEWANHYSAITEQKVKMLRTVKGIAPDKNKVDYAINKINLGKNWNFKQDNLDKMEKGMNEADEIIQSLGLTDEVTEFLDKVMDGRAYISDLTPDIVSWVKEKNLSSKLSINFK